MLNLFILKIFYLKMSSYSINDRGIHEIYESLSGGGDGLNFGFGGAANGGASAPSSPWNSPLLARRSVVTSGPTQMERGKLISGLQQ